MLANGDPDPRGVGAHAAVWYTTLHLVYTLDWNFSARAPSWQPPPPFRKGDLDAGRLPPQTYTRDELFPYIANPADRHLVYSYGVSQQKVNEWEQWDFHPIQLGMAGTDPGNDVHCRGGRGSRVVGRWDDPSALG